MSQERPIPILTTPRLVLRAFVLSDAKAVQKMAGDPAVADTTLTIPHPYPDGAAERRIEQHDRMWRQSDHVCWAICAEEGGLIGTMNLGANLAQGRAEIGYWIGREFWGRGFCTEAGRAVVEFGFEDLRLNRIFSCHLSRNPASGRVMEKLGMRREGVLRGHVLKNGRFEDSVYWGRLLTDGLGDNRL